MSLRFVLRAAAVVFLPLLLALGTAVASRF